jgi:hypothetical protein
VAWHWDSAYNVAFSGEVYTASRIGYPEHVLTAETTSELRQRIRLDYQGWQAGLRERSSL